MPPDGPSAPEHARGSPHRNTVRGNGTPPMVGYRCEVLRSGLLAGPPTQSAQCRGTRVPVVQVGEAAVLGRSRSQEFDLSFPSKHEYVRLCSESSTRQTLPRPEQI